MEPVFCDKCGARVTRRDRFCQICGNRIDHYVTSDMMPNEPYYSEYSTQPYNVQEYDEPREESKHYGRVIAIIGCLIIIASVFLPYISYSILGFGDSIHLIDDSDGVIFLIAAVIALLLFCFKSKIISLLATIAICGMSYYAYTETIDALESIGILAGLCDKGIGFYGIVIGAVFMAIGSFVNLFE